MATTFLGEIDNGVRKSTIGVGKSSKVVQKLPISVYFSGRGEWLNSIWGGVGLGCHSLWLTRVRDPPPVDCGVGLGWLGWQGCSLYGCLPPGGFESMEKQRKHQKSSRKASAATPEKCETIPWGGGGRCRPPAVHIWPYGEIKQFD